MQLLLLRRIPVRTKEVPEPAHVLLHPAIGHKASVAREDLRWRQGHGAVLVRVTEDKLSGLEGRTGAGRRHFTRALDHRLGKAVAVAEMIMGVIERWDGLNIKRRERFDAFAFGQELGMFERTTLQFRRITCKQDHDGMQVGACSLVDPVRGIIASGIAKYRRPCHHPLAEFLRQSGERGLVHPERPQAHSR